MRLFAVCLDVKVQGAAMSDKAAKAAFWSMIATIFAAGAAGAAAYIGYLQWQTLENSDATIRNANRAYVYFDRVELRPYPSPPDNVTVYGVTIVVTNSGNTPAYRLRIRSACPLLPASSPEEPPWPVDRDKTAGKLRMILGPKQTVSLQGCNLNPDQIAASKNGTRKIFVVAEATYEDTYDPNVPRVNQTVRRLLFDADGGHSFGFVGPHNCADDDCPK